MLCIFITQIVFSPTGGTQQVASIITSTWNSQIDEIDLANEKTDFSAYKFTQDEVAVIAVPSYAGRVPAPAAERIAKINGNQAQCVIVCVYGNRAYEDTLIELYNIAKQSNFKVIAAVAAIAEHSIMHQYATGRPDQQDKNELSSFARKIFDKIENDKSIHTSMLHMPGNYPYKKIGKIGLIPKAESNCISCGLCAEKCPTQAISKENLKITNNKKCISCMRCVTLCPKSARKVNGVMVSIAAFTIKKACLERKNNELFI